MASDDDSDLVTEPAAAEDYDNVEDADPWPVGMELGILVVDDKEGLTVDPLVDEDACSNITSEGEPDQQPSKFILLAPPADGPPRQPLDLSVRGDETDGTGSSRLPEAEPAPNLAKLCTIVGFFSSTLAKGEI